MFLYVISFMIVLTACSQNDVPSQGDFLESKPETEARADVTVRFYEDDNYIYSKEITEFSKFDQSFETGIVDIKPVYGQMPTITHIDDDLNLYTFVSSSDIYELGKYNLLTEEYSPIVTLEDNNTFGFILDVDCKYIVWKEVVAEGPKQSSSLHLFNKSEESDIEFYSDKINPDTGSIYVLDSNPAVIIGDKVIFDTVTGHGNDGSIEMDILCYDIVSENVTMVAEMAKRPMRYHDGVAYLRKNADNNSSLYSLINGKELFIADLDENIADYSFLGNTLCRSVNNYDDPNEEKLHVYSTSLYVGETSIPLIEGKQSNYTYNVRSNDKVLVWEITNPEKPIYYDIVNDRFVQLDQEEKRLYSSFAGKDFVLFLYRMNDDANSPIHYILINS